MNQLPTIRFIGPWSKSDAQALEPKLNLYRNDLRNVIELILHESKEASLLLPSDDAQLNHVVELAERFTNNQLKYILVIGIGGSNLGTKAIYEALKQKSTAQILFADSVSAQSITTIIDLLKQAHESEIVINVISKSGTTTETAANLDVIYHALSPFMPNITERIVYTTEENSALYNFAKSEGSAILPLSPFIGGRYSVFSAVGLFPLLLAGFDIHALRSGALTMRDSCLNGEVDIASESASMAYLANQSGVKVYDSFIFNAELESYGKWFRQLLGESIGKDGKGMIPTVSIGSQDLHSVAQCYFALPNVLYTSFMYANESNWPVVSRHQSAFIAGNTIPGKSLSTIMTAILDGTQESYAKQGMSFADIRLQEINEYSLGALMQYAMLQVMYFAHLLDVNAFDQPHVELYKQEVKKLLTAYDES